MKKKTRQQQCARNQSSHSIPFLYVFNGVFDCTFWRKLAEDRNQIKSNRIKTNRIKSLLKYVDGKDNEKLKVSMSLQCDGKQIWPSFSCDFRVNSI